MKPLSPALLVLTTISVLAAAPQGDQKQIWSDNKKDISVLARDGDIEFIGKGLSTIRFTVTGNVAFASRLQGIAGTAAKMTGLIEPDPARKGMKRLNELKASGGVTMILMRDETVGGRTVTGRTDAKGDTANYKAGANDSGTATLNGNVVIIDQLGERKVNLLGDAGTANFSTVQKGRSALKNATVTGNVRIKVTQVDEAGVAKVYNAAGDRLTYVNAGTSATLTLTGDDVKLDSPSEGGGNASNVRQLVLRLNGNGELAGVNATTTPGQKVRTVFKTKRSTPAKAPAKKGG